MYICPYIRMCIPTYTYINIYIYTYILSYKYMHMYIYTYIRIYIYTYIHIYIYTNIHIYIYTYIYTHMYTHVCTYSVNKSVHRGVWMYLVVAVTALHLFGVALVAHAYRHWRLWRGASSLQFFQLPASAWMASAASSSQQPEASKVQMFRPADHF